MPEMNDSGRNVSWTTGCAWSADFTRLATATPSAARQPAPSSERDHGGRQRVQVDVHAEGRNGDREQQHDGAEPDRRRARHPRAEVDPHRQRRPAHALEQPVVAGVGQAHDDRRVARGDEAHDRDRGRVELREADRLAVALDRRVAVQRAEQHDQHQREREREDDRARVARVRRMRAKIQGRQGHAVSSR